MKNNPDEKLKSIFEIEHDLKIKGKKSVDKTTPIRALKGWVWIQKGMCLLKLLHISTVG